jgi:FAD/FMN-containing dehydrogenase
VNSQPTSPKAYSSLVRRLRSIVGDSHVLDDPALMAQYESDWTGRFTGRASAVVRPANNLEVAAVLRACLDAAVPVVPQGGNTGLVGGGVPRTGEVVMSLTRLRDLGAIDPVTWHVDLGAGVTLATLQNHAWESGLDAGLDIASRDTATIGGLVACDAGGLRAMRYGTARARVTGLEVVLANGSVIDLRPPVLKDNAGYDLPALMIGSEGTLGVITRVRWRLVQHFQARVAALVPLPSIDAAVRLLSSLRPRLPSLDAAEFTVDATMRRVVEHLGVAAPFPDSSPVYLLLECAAHEDPTEGFFEALQDIGVEDALVATDKSDRLRLWRLREAHSEAVAALGAPKKFDVGVPLDRLQTFLEQVPSVVHGVDSQAETFLFGHLGDGNVHVNVLAEDAGYHELGRLIYGLAVECGGTISAEHGIGVEKAQWLHRLCSDGEIQAMLQIKRALDPSNVLNPGVGLPGDSTA